MSDRAPSDPPALASAGRESDPARGTPIAVLLQPVQETDWRRDQRPPREYSLLRRAPRESASSASTWLLLRKAEVRCRHKDCHVARGKTRVTHLMKSR